MKKKNEIKISDRNCIFFLLKITLCLPLYRKIQSLCHAQFMKSENETNKLMIYFYENTSTIVSLPS